MSASGLERRWTQAVVQGACLRTTSDAVLCGSGTGRVDAETGRSRGASVHDQMVSDRRGCCTVEVHRQVYGRVVDDGRFLFGGLEGGFWFRLAVPFGASG